MHYEINISKNGQHYFATASRSLTDEEKAKEIHRALVAAFPASQGFKIEVTHWENLGHVLDWETSMSCINAMISCLLKNGFEFDSIPEAREQLRNTCAGNPEEPFSFVDYDNWSGHLRSLHDWSVVAVELKVAREEWIASLGQS